MSDRFDWDDLRYLLAVARAGTLGGAARGMGVEHTTVGRRLAALEDALGIKVLTRTPDGFTPTPAGKDVLALAEEVERAIQGIERRAADDLRIAGRVRITTSEAFSAFLVRKLPSLRAKYPEVTVEILSDNRALDLCRGDADIAVRMLKPEGDLLGRCLGETGWSLYASPEYVARKGRVGTPTALCGHDVIGFDVALQNTPGGRFLEGAENVVFRVNSILAAHHAASVGFGIAALPCFMATDLVRLTDAVVGSRQIWMLAHADRASIPRVRAVMDHLDVEIRADAGLLSGVTDQGLRPDTR